MPNYEYHCQACDRVFVMTMRVNEHDTAEVRCPQCKGTDVHQVLSSFVAITSRKS
jgi:putative FmdB family regulatory protein